MTRSRSRGPGTPGHRRSPRAVRAALATVVVGVIAGVVAGLGTATPSIAATPDARRGPVAATVVATVTPDATAALVTLSSVAPSVVQPGTDVTITGTVTAPRSGALTTPTVRVVRVEEPIRSRVELDAWASGTTAGTGATAAQTTLATVAASNQRAFSLVVPAAALRSREAFAALPVAVEVVGRGTGAPAGVTRTFLAWNSRKEFEPIQLATLLPVTLDPVVDLFSQTQAARDAAWETVIGDGSRLRRLVAGTAGSAATLAVDPAVFGPTSGSPAGTTSTTTPTTTPRTTPTTTPAPPTPATTTPSVTPTPTTSATGSPGPPGSPTPGPDAVVAGLADTVAGQLRGRSLLALPYADADVAATSDLGPSDDHARSLVSRSSLVAGVLGTAVRADVAWPVDGLLPAGREEALQSVWAGSTVARLAGIVVDQRSVTGDSPYSLSARRVAAGGTRLLAYDARLSALLPRRFDPSPVLSTQRFLAESLVLLGERAGTPRSALVVAPRTYDPDPTALAAFLAATASAPWLEPVGADALLTDRVAETAVPAQQPVTPTASAAPSPTLTRARLAQLRSQRSTMLSVAQVLADGSDFAAVYGELLDQLRSARWRWAPAGWASLGTSLATDITAATRAIRVVPRSFNLLAETGTLQVSVVNGLAYAVKDLRLRVVPDNPRVQILEQPGPISIEPGSRTIVPVQVAAVAVGKVEITASLTTADGTVIGTKGVITVQANPLDAAIYWVVGVLAGLVLLAGIARTVLRGTSRIDEIEDIEAVTAAHAAGEHVDRG